MGNARKPLQIMTLQMSPLLSAYEPDAAGTSGFSSPGCGRRKLAGLLVAGIVI